MSFQLTDKQQAQMEAAASGARHVLAYGGSRSGKTFGFCWCIANRALMAPESRHLVARLHNVDVRQSVLQDTWPKMMKLAFPGVDYKINKQDQVVRMPDDAEVWFAGLDDKERVEKILGKEYATIYVNETSQVVYDTILTLRTRLAQNVSKRDGRHLGLKAYYDLNPVGRSHWTYKEFVQKLRPDGKGPVEAGSRAYVHMNPMDNPYLSAEYHQELASLPERKRLRFEQGEYQAEVPGALWTPAMLEAARCDANAEGQPIDKTGKVIDMARVVVAIDPSGTDGGEDGDEVGIVVAGRGVDGRGYVLADDSCRLSPDGWARRAVSAYHRYSGDRIVAERNFGGAMVASVVRQADRSVPFKEVVASRGKAVRAEPVSALFEQGRVSIVGALPELEDQLVLMTPGGYLGEGSPDRLDAMVWALTEVMLGHVPQSRAESFTIPKQVSSWRR